MVLLNHIATHLFGNEEAVAKELEMDEDTRKKLWKEHIENYHKREQLCKFFNYKNIYDSLHDIEKLREILEEIQSSISEEFIHIRDEEKLDEEIIGDIRRLKPEHHYLIIDLSESLVRERHSNALILALFEKMHHALKVELHTIRLILKKLDEIGNFRDNPNNLADNPNLKEYHESIEELLLQLFGLIYHTETHLYKPFMEEYYEHTPLHVHKELCKTAEIVILGEKLKQEILDDSEKFAKDAVKHMANPQSEKFYRKIGEDMMIGLAKRAGAPFTEENLEKGFDEMERLLKNWSAIQHEALITLHYYRKVITASEIEGIALAFMRTFSKLDRFSEELHYVLTEYAKQEESVLA